MRKCDCACAGASARAAEMLYELEIEEAYPQTSERIEDVYARVFRLLKPRTALLEVEVRFRQYANANSRIRLHDGTLTVDISDLLENAPAVIQEALASILIAKLFRKLPEPAALARYRRYLNRSDIRHTLQRVKRQRGRKTFISPAGGVYDLSPLFEELNQQYFDGLMARPELGWSKRPSRTTLGHYDPSHHAIVLSSLLDDARAPKLIVRYVLFHEMLHLRYPTDHRGARRCVHTPEFRAAERQFDDYRRAESELRKFVEESAL